MTAPPTPSDQLRFLQQLQRVLTEGQFNATYKFALLHAIADLCVERGDEGSGAELTLTIVDLTTRFCTLYRRQARPYLIDGKKIELKHAKGKQARVVKVLREPAKNYDAGSRSAEVPRKILADINETIRDQPLWKLQNVAGGDRLEFLYTNTDKYSARDITLQPGIAYCFRSFHGFIVSLVRSRWESWIRQTNAQVLQNATDLREFLFGADRRDLTGFKAVLLEIHGRKCFYTNKPLRGEMAVDHFIPWSRYSVDLGHNFLLTSRSVNSQKADNLAAEAHLERWLGFCLDHRKQLESEFQTRKLPHNLPASLAIAEWSYETVAESRGRVWKHDKSFSQLSPNWRDLIEDARREISNSNATPG